MLCQNCNENEANITYIQMINDNKKEMILCEKCAKKLGINNMKFSIPLNFSNVFSDFLEPEMNFMQALTIPKQTECKDCKMTYEDFVKFGKFGCSNCYETFSNKIEPILKKLHGSLQYVGKRNEKESNIKINVETSKPGTDKTKEEKIEELKRNLKQLIKIEKYEEAEIGRAHV